MKQKLYFAFSIAAVLSMMVSGAAALQLSPDPENPRPIQSAPSSWTEEAGLAPMGGGRQLAPKFDRDALFASSQPQAVDVPTGAPGMTFSHAQTFGTTESAYFDDTQHLVYPYGVGAVGSTLWIADTEGNRALKFNSSGVYQNLTIGKAGFREFYEDEDLSMEWVSDVAEDASGNIWIVDGGTRYVSKFSPTGDYLSSIGEQWVSGSGDYQFDQPRGIAFDASGNIYISDRNNNRIQIFDSAGNKIATLTYSFNRPERIAIQGSMLYVADERNHVVKIFNITNPLAITFWGQIGVAGSSGSGNDKLDDPCGVAANANYIFVADRDNGRVQVFINAAPYSYYATIGSSGSGNGQFSGPYDVALDAAGNIYVADTWNMRVQQFNSSRAFVRIYGTTDVPYLTDNYHYYRPNDVAVAADGSIYISEGRGRRVVKLASNGDPIWKFGVDGTYGDDNAHLGYPEKIALAPDGRVFVADGGNNRIQVLSSAGAYLATVGEYGTGNGQFDYPTGVAFDASGNLYVADAGNCRIQIFNTSLTFTTSFGSCGYEDNQFSWIRDLAVDSTGRIYAVDGDAHKVKLYSAGRVFLRSIGTGVTGNAYDRLSNPVAVAVDRKDRVYIADHWGSSIRVYDKDGKFLDIVENGNGSFQGIFRQASGLAVDSHGSLFLADEISHLVKRYNPGAYPGWRQVNVAGFGSYYNWSVWSMTVFSDTLFASTATYYGDETGGAGAEIYQFEQGGWTQVMSGGFGSYRNMGIDAFEEFNDKLYAGTWNQYWNTVTETYQSDGGAIYRSADPSAGAWEQVAVDGMDDLNNWEFVSLRSFDGYLYAGTYVWDTSVHGAEIYRSPSGDAGSWTKVFSDATPSHDKSEGVLVMLVFNNQLYAGFSNFENGSAEVWRTSDGADWEQANADGFGDPFNKRILTLAEFDGWLYAGTGSYDSVNENSTGGQVWRSQNGSTWEKVVDGGFGDPNNWGVGGLIVYDDQLYAIGNYYNYANQKQQKGMSVWRSDTGDSGDWQQIAAHSFGAEHSSAYHYWHGNFVVHDDLLYIGTNASNSSGGRIWSLWPHSIFLPLIMR